MTPRWRLRTLGGATLLRDGVAVSGAAVQRRRIALLAVLAIAGDEGMSRDKLLALLWPESSPEGARRALNQLVFLVRRDLESSDVIVGGSELRLNPEIVTSDIAELDRALRKGDDAAVVALYAGVFLDGFFLGASPEFEQWQEEQRSRLTKGYAQALERLAAAADARGDLNAGLSEWRRLAALDPLNSRVATELVRALARSGNIAGALQHARLHESQLAQELGVPMDPVLQSLVLELKTPRAIPRPDHPAERAVAAQGGGPLSPTPIPESPRPDSVAGRNRSRRWRWALAAAILVIVSAGALLVRQRSTAPKLDDQLIAVAPFEVLDPALALWREGLMDVLTRALDGAGPLRAVPPGTIARYGFRRGNLESAVTLGRSMGAGLVLYGALLRSGRDSVRATATLVSATKREILAEREARDEIDHMDRLADSLAVGIVKDLGARSPIRAVRAPRAAALGTSSLPALKAFLRAEQQLRQGYPDSAHALYAKAAELDPHFALALHGLSWTLSAGTTLADPEYEELASRAQSLNHGLSRRDSLLILIDSLRAAGEYNATFEFPRVSVAWANALASQARQVAAEYRDSETLYQLADIQVHFASLLGTHAADILQAFDRAIAADSSFAPAYEHVVSTALVEGDTSRARRYIRAIERHAPLTNAGRSAAVVRLALDRRLVSRENLASLLDTVPLDPLRYTVGPVSAWADSSETSLLFGEYLLDRSRRELPDALPATNTVVALLLAVRGNYGEAYRRLDRRWDGAAQLLAELALLGVVPDSEARAEIARWRRRGPLYLARAAPWWAAHGDTLSLRALRSSVAPDLPDSLGGAAYVRWSADLYLARARGDTDAAVGVCDAVSPASLPFRFLEDVDCGQLLMARGRNRDAAVRLTPRTYLFGPLVLVERTLQWARAAEQSGDVHAAAKGYAFVRAVRRRPRAVGCESCASR